DQRAPGTREGHRPWPHPRLDLRLPAAPGHHCQLRRDGRRPRHLRCPISSGRGGPPSPRPLRRRREGVRRLTSPGYLLLELFEAPALLALAFEALGDVAGGCEGPQHFAIDDDDGEAELDVEL